MISDYDKILLDVSGTLYCKNKTPLEGSKDFIEKYYDKIIIFSNIGSKTGSELRDDLYSIYNIPIPKVSTSLDLLFDHLSIKNYNKVFHYGNDNVTEKISPFTKKIMYQYDKDIDALIFTSLISENWIPSTDVALNIMMQNNVEIILANPDRISPNPPYNFTVSLIADGLLGLTNRIIDEKNIIEFGKPYLTKQALGINKNEKLVTIGDNPWTDVKQSKLFNCTSILISSETKKYSEDLSPTYVFKSLKHLL